MRFGGQHSLFQDKWKDLRQASISGVVAASQTSEELSVQFRASAPGTVRAGKTAKTLKMIYAVHELVHKVEV